MTVEPTDGPTTITVFGSGRCPAGSETYDLAYRLGRAIGARGWTLCNGGYGGAMEASARGAREAGGRTIGVTWAIGSGQCNPFIDREIPAGDLYERLQKLLDLGQAYVALPGGTGTLLELALVWELVHKRIVGPRPIVLLGEFWADLPTRLARDDPRCPRAVRQARTVDDAVALVAEALGVR